MNRRFRASLESGGRRRGAAVRKTAAGSRKPNSVRRLSPCGEVLRDNHSSRPGIAGGFKQPTRRLRTGRPLSPTHTMYAGACRLPIWPCSVRGFACHLPYSRRGALLPHLFTLTPPSRLSPLQRGGIFSVPLSFELPRPGITRRTALWSSDFPLAFALRSSGFALRRGRLLTCGLAPP